MVQIWDVVGFDEVADLQKMPQGSHHDDEDLLRVRARSSAAGSGLRGRQHRDVRQHQPAGRRDGPDGPPVRADAGRDPRRHGVHRPAALLPPGLGNPEDAERALHGPLRLRRRLPRRGASRDCGSTTSPRSSTATSRSARISTPATEGGAQDRIGADEDPSSARRGDAARSSPRFSSWRSRAGAG